MIPERIIYLLLITVHVNYNKQKKERFPPKNITWSKKQ